VKEAKPPKEAKPEPERLPRGWSTKSPTVEPKLRPHRAQIIREYVAGGTFVEMAHRWNVSKEALRLLIHRWLEEDGREPRKQPVYEYPEELILPRLEAGEKVPSIASDLGVPKGKLYRWLRRRGIWQRVKREIGE
jgi:hypothetical protein